MKNILTAEKINFGYSEENPILQDFNILLKPGGMTGLIGPNGAGKSTALKILSGYLKPRSGKVFLKEEKLSAISHKQRSAVIAVVGQDVFSPLPFTVRQIVEMGRTVRISRFSALSHQDISLVDSAMNEMDVFQFESKYFNQLSGGEKQRVKIAAALAQQPEILLLDEPTSQLDMGHGNRLMQHLQRLNRERNLSILLVSHDIQLISRFMQEFILLKNGSIIANGDAESVLQAKLIEDAYGCQVNILKIGNFLQIIPETVILAK